MHDGWRGHARQRRSLAFAGGYGKHSKIILAPTRNIRIGICRVFTIAGTDDERGPDELERGPLAFHFTIRTTRSAAARARQNGDANIFGLFKGLRAAVALMLQPAWRTALAEEGPMKLAAFAFTVGVAITMAAPVTSANAQMGGGHHRRGDGGDQKPPAKKPQVDERAYNEALKTIPDSKEKFDPWGSLGVPSAEKKPK